MGNGQEKSSPQLAGSGPHLVLPELALFLLFLCSHPLALQLSSFPSHPPPSCLFSQGRADVENCNPSVFTSEISFGRCPAETPSAPWPYPLALTRAVPTGPILPVMLTRGLFPAESPRTRCAHGSPPGVSGHTARGKGLKPAADHLSLSLVAGRLQSPRSTLAPSVPGGIKLSVHRGSLLGDVPLLGCLPVSFSLPPSLPPLLPAITSPKPNLLSKTCLRVCSRKQPQLRHPLVINPGPPVFPTHPWAGRPGGANFPLLCARFTP